MRMLGTLKLALVGRSRCQRSYLMSLAARANEERLQLFGFLYRDNSLAASRQNDLLFRPHNDRG